MLLNQLAEGRLAGVDNVQKAVLVLLVIVQLLDLKELDCFIIIWIVDLNNQPSR